MLIRSQARWLHPARRRRALPWRRHPLLVHVPYITTQITPEFTTQITSQLCPTSNIEQHLCSKFRWVDFVGLMDYSSPGTRGSSSKTAPRAPPAPPPPNAPPPCPRNQHRPTDPTLLQKLLRKLIPDWHLLVIVHSICVVNVLLCSQSR